MAKYEPIELVKSYSGKICEHSDVYFAKKGKTLYTGKICNPRTKAFSEAELARQNKFKTAINTANTALADATQRAAYETAFAGQSKYKSLRGYVIAKEYEKLGD